MSGLKRLSRNEEGSAAVEMAFALPPFVLMLWMLAQLGLVYQALAGMQQALGEGARYATLCLDPDSSGCTTPAAADIQTRIRQSVYGTGIGTFSVPLPSKQSDGTSSYYDLTVTYRQPINMLLFPGPTITLSRSKRVWVAGS